MWFQRRRRRSPPSELQPSLDRLGELVARVVDLLDDGTPAEPRPPLPHVVVKVEPETPPARPERAAEPVPAAAPEPDPAGWVAYVPSPHGYRLVVESGAPPARGAAIEVEGARFRVLRLGRSPLPGDRRRCAFLEGEEPRAVERTSDG